MKFRMLLTMGCSIMGAAPYALSSAQAADFTLNAGNSPAGAQTLTIGETGTIETTGSLSINAVGGAVQSATGITTSDDNVTITNDGAILVNTNAAAISVSFGIYIGGDNATITNNGTITTTATAGTSALSAGISINGNNTTITNNSTVSATGTAATTTVNSISINGNNTTLILGENSNTPNGVSFSGTNNVVQYTVGQSFPEEGGGFGTGLTAAPDLSGFTGTYTVNEISNPSSIPAGAIFITSGGKTLAVTPDIFASSDQIIITQNAAQAGNLVIHHQQRDLIQNALNTSQTSKPTHISDVEPAAGGSATPQNNYWLEGFGSYKERPKDGGAAFSRARSGGVLIGVDFPETPDGYKSGIYISGFAGSHALGQTTFRKIESKGALVGGYVNRAFKGFNLSAQLSGGFAEHDSDRNVDTEIANAAYHSVFFSPALTIMRPYSEVVNGVTFVPSVTARYTGQYIGGYKENGSSANQNVKSRFHHALGLRVQTAAYLDSIRLKEGLLTPVFRLGIEGATTIGSQNTDLTVLGTNVSFSPSGGDNFIDGIAGFSLSYNADNGPIFYFDSEASVGLNKAGAHNNIGGIARFGVRWLF